MEWNGNIIKERAKSKKISLTEIARLLHVTRQTVNDWVKGQVPKGTHFFELSKLLDVNPEDFFIKENIDYFFENKTAITDAITILKTIIVKEQYGINEKNFNEVMRILENIQNGFNNYDENDLIDEFCKKMKCNACSGIDINGEPNGYGCKDLDDFMETYGDRIE